jgi:hypothetical protein
MSGSGWSFAILSTLCRRTLDAQDFAKFPKPEQPLWDAAGIRIGRRRRRFWGFRKLASQPPPTTTTSTPPTSPPAAHYPPPPPIATRPPLTFTDNYSPQHSREPLTVADPCVQARVTPVHLSPSTTVDQVWIYVVIINLN